MESVARCSKGGKAEGGREGGSMDTYCRKALGFSDFRGSLISCLNKLTEAWLIAVYRCGRS